MIEYFLCGMGLLGLLRAPIGDASDDSGIAKLLSDAVHRADAGAHQAKRRAAPTVVKADPPRARAAAT